jgi:hypothetical protein
MASISPALQQWAVQALDLGFGCFGDGDHAPFVTIVDDSGQRQLVDLEEDQ